jgi:DNA invertase Pin-like site-specific DNA recombinase
MNEKIHATHLERDAYVYVRQSSAYQVQHNLEGQRRQYALADRAAELGFRRVVTIDEDQGRSGSGSVERPGFGRLLAAVCEGQVGAVLALEASRLARNNRDWHHLIDLCSLTATLVIDMEGVYDPRLLNDRLLLGLKGSMSEFEIGLLRQRARAAIDAMAARGEIVVAVPVGFTRSEDSRIELDPDRQVQSAIRLVFSKFRELGTVRQTVLWFREEGVSLPHRPKEGPDLRWSLPTYPRILGILQHPGYAGAYAWGRSRRQLHVVDGRAHRVAHRRRLPEEWPVLLRGHHEGYITWEDYVRNQDTTHSNRAGWSPGVVGSPRAGSALLSGLLRCGRCGRRVKATYGGRGGRVARYACNEHSRLTATSKTCLYTGAVGLDAAVVEQVLLAVGPEGLHASLEAIEQMRAQVGEKQRALALAVEKARYETERRRRQYEAVEPENRLVAASLEQRWEEALRGQEEAEARLAEAQREERALSPEECHRLTSLGQDLPTLWCHPDCPVEMKKRLLRTVIEEVVIDLEENPPQLLAQIHWKGGVHTVHRLRRRPSGSTRFATPGDVVELVRSLAQILADRSIATVLNRLGHRTGHGGGWTRASVCAMRNHYGIPILDRSTPAHVVTLEGAAGRLGITPRRVRALARHGALPVQRLGDRAPWIIKVVDLDRPEVQEAVRAIKAGVRRPWTDARQHVIPFPTTT